MEIRIDVPPLMYQSFAWLHAWLLRCQQAWHRVGDVGNWCMQALESVTQLPRNVLLTLSIMLFLFWPVLLSLLVAVSTAWTWLFWLLTSIIFGILQLQYVTYQFVMIFTDICGLSALKTYSMLRNNVVSILDKTTSSSSVRQSRRKQWMKQVEAAPTYEEFLKIRLAVKDETSAIDSALPPALQAAAANTAKDAATMVAQTIHTETPVTGQTNPLTSMLPRSQSWVQLSPTRSVGIGTGGDRILRRSSSGNELLESSSTSPPHVAPVVREELGKTAELLVGATQRLRDARVLIMGGGFGGSSNLFPAPHNDTEDDNQQDNNIAPTEEAIQSLVYLLSGILKRNHLGLDDIIIENARVIEERGQYGLTQGSRQVLRNYLHEVQACLDCLAEAAVPSKTLRRHSLHHQPNSISEDDVDDGLSPQLAHLGERVTQVRKMKHNFGRTALMLSGGGAIAMYHLGVIRALIEAKLYQDIKVISGTSGGSIAAAMCAMKTDEELYNDVLVPEVSTDFSRDGRMKAENIRWFPSVAEMATYWLKKKLLVDSAEFRRTCDFYYADMTFEEAFQRTGKNVCITVSASRPVGDTAQRLLLNHISTPHVTLASAVAASCALPGVMAPAKLMAKNSNGQLEPFEVDGVEWIDGSVQADLPFQRIASLFAVTSFIVSQTNFHVVPFLYKAHHPSQKSLYWRLFQTLEWDIRNRALKLSKLGLFPRIFGQDISRVFKQKYYGSLTIVPRFTTMQTLGLKALANPTVEEMEGYLKYGQIATWPYLNAIRDMIRFEKALDDCLNRLGERLREIHPEADWDGQDDIDSIASSSVFPSSSSRVRIIGRHSVGNGLSIRDRESERLRHKVKEMDAENRELKRQLAEMQRLLAASTDGENGNSTTEEDESLSQHEIADVNTHYDASLSEGHEGGVWNLLLRKQGGRS